jgi:hypothetical protein
MIEAEVLRSETILLKRALIPGHEMIDSCCSAAIPRSLEA